MRVANILVPIDFSECSLIATREAASLASQLKASVTLLHVDKVPHAVSPDAMVQIDGVEMTAHDHMERTHQKALEPFKSAVAERGVAVRTVHEGGPTAEVIVAVADRIGTDMVVMSTHGRTGVSRVLLGSVAEDTVRHANVPVLLIRREVRPECEKTSCEWCAHQHLSRAEEQLEAELDG